MCSTVVKREGVKTGMYDLFLRCIFESELKIIRLSIIEQEYLLLLYKRD